MAVEGRLVLKPDWQFVRIGTPLFSEGWLKLGRASSTV
jgi:hypothetical protein